MLRDLINTINNFNCNPVVLEEKKIGKTSNNYHFWVQLVQKRHHYGPHPNQKTILLKK